LRKLRHHKKIKCAQLWWINLYLLPSPPLSERRRYCDARRDAWRHAVCLCVRNSLGGEGNALYPVLSSLVCIGFEDMRTHYHKHIFYLLILQSAELCDEKIRRIVFIATAPCRGPTFHVATTALWNKEYLYANRNEFDYSYVVITKFHRASYNEKVHLNLSEAQGLISL